MDDDELGEVGSVPRSSQLPSLQTNSGTNDSSLLICFGPLLNSPTSYSLNYDSQQPSSSRSNISSDVMDLANSVLTWNSTEEFCKFCYKIRLSFNSRAEVGNFLNLVRSEQSLPPVNLDDNAECLELFRALSFASNN